MIRKLMLCPWFGPFPDWMPSWVANVKRLREYGYDFLIDTDLARFKRLTKQLVGVEFPGKEGGSKIHDYRAVLGVIYADQIHDGRYDFWGHTDFDCLYGRVDRYVTDEFLDGLDVHSNHDTYLCGPWALYRPTDELVYAYEGVGGWRDVLADPRTTGWVEDRFSREIEDRAGTRLAYTLWQTKDWNRFHTLRWGDSGALLEGSEEVMMAHFRRLRPKIYPPQCLLDGDGDFAAALADLAPSTADSIPRPASGHSSVRGEARAGP